MDSKAWQNRIKDRANVRHDKSLLKLIGVRTGHEVEQYER